MRSSGDVEAAALALPSLSNLPRGIVLTSAGDSEAMAELAVGFALAMLPIALGLGADPSFRSPMAVVVLGGLITSTCLSLLVIPVVYSYVDDPVQWIQNKAPHDLNRAGL